jgi:hypothetical protein
LERSTEVSYQQGISINLNLKANSNLFIVEKKKTGEILAAKVVSHLDHYFDSNLLFQEKAVKH